MGKTDLDEHPCPQCGTVNRGTAKYCQKCGRQLLEQVPMEKAPAKHAPMAKQAPAPPAAQPGGSGSTGGSRSFLSDVIEEMEGMARDAKGMVQNLANALLGEPRRTTHQQPQPTPGPKSAPRPVSTPGPASTPRPVSTPGPPSAPTRLVAQLIAPKAVGELVGGYVIQNVWPLQHSNYYKVHMGRCPQGHLNPGAASEKCSTCQTELKVFLVRETQARPQHIDEASRHTLLQLSSSVPGFLKHIAVFEGNGRSEAMRRYVVCEYPGEGWQSLSQISLPVKIASAADRTLLTNWCFELGQALSRLQEQKLFPDFSALADFLEPVIIYWTAVQTSRAPHHQQAVLADLTTFSRSEEATLTNELRQKPVVFLAQILYTLTSGKLQILQRAPRDFSDVPPPFRKLVSGAARKEFADLEAYLEAFKNILKLPESTRSLRQIAGYRTDVGRRRDHNEDFIGKYSLGMQQTPDTPEVGLYLVADGMGGHQGGELASRDVAKVILSEIQEHIQELQTAPKLKRSTIKLDQVVPAGEILKQAVLRANEVLYNARQQISSDRGTTLTAALIVGETSAIANVGDSRTYLWRDGKLSQITRDHSLVASLLAANMVKPDEVRDHPQRNQIYRSLGERPTVEVDIYECTLQAGDRLLLCSDGLWEMALDAEIQQILQQAANPQEACDRLIEAANLAGGEDNISAATVWIA